MGALGTYSLNRKWGAKGDVRTKYFFDMREGTPASRTRIGRDRFATYSAAAAIYGTPRGKLVTFHATSKCWLRAWLEQQNS